MKKYNISELKKHIEIDLINDIKVKDSKSYDPIEIEYKPKNWLLIGTGNYAAVFSHQDFPDLVVKVYIRGKESLKHEVEVYNQLGSHPSYPNLLGYGKSYLILTKIEGITLYDSIHKGKRIPEEVIKDVNNALQYAKKRGLNPHDVHGKNIIIKNGRGFVIDVSDFHKNGKDDTWDDLVKAYYKFYKHTLYKYTFKIPYIILDVIRHSYRFYKNLKHSTY